MTTINTVKSLAKKLLNKTFTIPVGMDNVDICVANHGYIFKFDNSKVRFGLCHYTLKEISLSKPICENNLDKLNTEIKNVILHEIAHAIDHIIFGKSDGHGKRWKSIAKHIGCTGERCYNVEDINHPKSKYTLKCNKCGNELPMYKKPQVSKSCRCNPNKGYSEDYKFEVIQNY